MSADLAGTSAYLHPPSGPSLLPASRGPSLLPAQPCFIVVSFVIQMEQQTQHAIFLCSPSQLQEQCAH